MAEFLFDKATKKVSVDAESLQKFSDEERKQAQQSVDLVNQLMTDLTNVNGEVPVLQRVSENVTVSSAKIAKNGIKALQQGKPEDAVKLLSTALEMVLRRPLWEPTLVVLEEVSNCLGPRCDAYSAMNRLADAYADASLLMLIKPQEPVNYFRKGGILVAAGKLVEGRELLATASSRAPQVDMFQKALAEVDRKIAESQPQ